MAKNKRNGSARVATTSAAKSANGKGLTYADTGVDIEAGDEVVGRIKGHMRKTYGPRVLGKHGAFAGMFRLDFNEKLFKRNYRDPVLVSCTDGVGSKVKLACDLGIYNTVGQDVVAMNVNDLIVQGAEPLFFLDYIGVHKVDPPIIADIVEGVADGCQLSGCALLGGETAELPDLYSAGEFDLAGFSVGVCELNRIVDGSRAEAGDVILGLASTGVHSNGYSLVRAVLKKAKLDMNRIYPALDAERTLGEILMTPTRIYAKSIVAALRKYKVKQVISAMCHVTGGGLPGNVPRVLNDTIDARISRKAWKVPPVFNFLQKHGDVAEDEMLRVFNMGIGYIVVVRPHFAESIARLLTQHGETVSKLGKIVKGSGKLQLK